MPLENLDPEKVTQAAQATKSAAGYWEIIMRVAPVSILGGIVAFLVNLNRITNEDTWKGRLLTFVSVIGVGLVVSGVAVLGLSLWFNSPTAEIDVVVGCIAGASGQKVFDIYSRRLFGSTKNDIESSEDK